MTMNKMDIKNDLWQKVCKAHEKLDEEKYPEMMLYLNLFLVKDQINQDYMDLANKFGVSTVAAFRRLYDLSIISDSQYYDMYKEINNSFEEYLKI